MKKNKGKKEYTTDEEVITAIVHGSVSVMPSEDSLRAVLDSLPQAPKTVSSPYIDRGVFSIFHSRMLVTSFALLLLVVAGGAAYSHSHKDGAQAPDMNGQTTYSDASIDQDLAAIDMQMSALDSGTDNVDTAGTMQ